MSSPGGAGQVERGQLARALAWGSGRRMALNGRMLLTILLVGAFALSLTEVPWGSELVHSGGGATMARLVTGIVQPDLSVSVLRTALSATWITIVYAVTGMSVALLLALPLGAIASGCLVRQPGIRRTTMVAARVVLGGQRAIHELVWAWLFVAAIGLSPFAAILAIGIPYAGILGRIYADLLNDVPEGPLRSLRSSGASEPAVFLYGRFPAVLPSLTSYTFYRFECAIRSSAIMSFVGLSGLGFQITIALEDLKYHQVGTYLLALFLLVVAADVLSSVVRRRLTG